MLFIITCIKISPFTYNVKGDILLLVTRILLAVYPSS